jgi:hypothetical protein
VSVPKVQTSPVFSIEIEEPVFKRLATIAAKEGVNINELGSALLRDVLMLHRSEINRAVETVKRRHA